jgi:hypothetical protein
MFQRYSTYQKHVNNKRKIFTEVQKRIIACRQNYMCVGEICKGEKILPETWELDHEIPLCQGGTNYYNFRTGGHTDPKNNVNVKCPGCHAIKTQQEKSFFYAEERKHKYEEDEFIPASEYYKNRSTPIVNISPYFDPSSSKCNIDFLSQFEFKGNSN